ncbi:MAG: hypothetical protein HGB23_12350 [Chlorobiaceae bacterium]|nr:hypothetical protein [Chlorobiaceae bacterium]
MDLIVSYGAPATQAVVHEKSNIPILYVGMYEPDQAGVTGKNITGCGFKVPLSSIIRYFKHLKPLNTLGIVFTSAEEDSVRQYKTMAALAAQQNIKTEKIDIGSYPDLNKLKAGNTDAVFITGSSLAHLWIKDILSILKKRQIPTTDIFPDDSDAGLLITLSHPPLVQGKMAAEMALQILLNKKPDAIPPYTSRDTELVYNLVEAKIIGITIPIDQLIEANRVIK